jgi:hypothetical protein
MSLGLFQAGGFALRASVLSFASPKESSQRKGDPRVGALRVPCATRNAGRLAKLACGSDNASRLPPALLRCSAPLMGARKASTLNWCAPKIDSHGQRSGNVNFFNSFNPPSPPCQGGVRSARHALLLPLTRGRPGGGWFFSPLTFFWPPKRKYARPPGGTPSQSKPPASHNLMLAPKGATP